MNNPVKREAVFIDRDGTINPDSGFISTPDNFELYPYAAKAIKLLNDSNYYVFLITNQSGIARGILSIEDLNNIHLKMNELLATEEAFIDHIFFAPFFANGTVEPYNIAHIDRKPGIGMFLQAKKLYDFDVKNSYVVGDRYTDILFGKNAGMKTILVRSGEGDKAFLNERHTWEIKPDFIAKDLLAATRFITAIK